MTLTPQDFARDELGHGTHAIDLDGQVHGFDPSIAQALIERKILYKDADSVWRLNCHGFPDLGAAAPMGYLSLCDFCGARPTTWDIPCETFAMPKLPELHGAVPTAMSADAWAACETCGGHIAANRRAALTEHCVRAHDDPNTSRHVRRLLKKWHVLLHKRFWQHYRGGARRVPARPFGH